MLLSIMIPAVFDRVNSPLIAELNQQLAFLDKDMATDVEVLALYDNRRRSTGLKRQALLNMAQGKFLTCLDDDDYVAPTYLADITSALKLNLDADVLVFNSSSTLDGEEPFIVRTGIEYENEQCYRIGPRTWADIHRKPWHWCVFNAKHGKAASFPDGYIDDDWYWLRQMMPNLKQQIRIDKVLHYYTYNSKKSLSNQGKPTT